MKLRFFLFLLSFLFNVVFLYSDSNSENPSRVSVNLGTKYLSNMKYDSGIQMSKTKGFVFGGSGKYKYQKKNRLYTRIRGSYYEAEIRHSTKAPIDQDKIKFYERQLEAAVGYTFICCNDAVLVSPFICLGWFYNNDKLIAEDGKFFKRKFYGLLWMLGIDLNWKIYKNFEAGLIASVGSNLDSRYKLNDHFGELSYRLKNRLCYEIVVPVNYCYNDWRFGLQLSHARKTFQFFDNHKFILHTFGLAATGAYTF